MKYVLLLSALVLLVSCSSTADLRETGSPLEQLAADGPPVDDDRSFGYLKDEWADHVDACVRGWSFTTQAIGRGVARDWERIEKTFR